MISPQVEPHHVTKLIAPTIELLLVFVAFPVLSNFSYAFTEWYDFAKHTLNLRIAIMYGQYSLPEHHAR